MMNIPAPVASINNLANQKFHKAVRKAHWRTFMSWLLHRCNKLIPLDRAAINRSMCGQRYAGVQVVDLDLIVGSEGRFREFDRAFFPLQTHTVDRWLNLYVARYQRVVLPPVDLIKVGEQYFVTDGNHRISVARVLGQQVIEAQVLEICTADFEEPPCQSIRV